MPADPATLTPLERAEAFRELIDSTRGAVLAVCHNYPDPDSLGAAMGMRAFLERVCNRECIITFGGGLGRAENRAMVGILGINPVLVEDLPKRRYAGVITLDTQPGAGNGTLPSGQPVLAVFDHHPPPKMDYETQWRDVRPDYGTTSTILSEYLDALGVEPGPQTATALLLGIRTDTEDLERDATDADVVAYVSLLTRADRDAMNQVMNPPLSEAYFGLLRTALRVARRWGEAVVANVGPVPSPDMLSTVSELFVQLKGVQFSLAVGEHEGAVYLSLRSSRITRKGTLEMIRAVVGEEGRIGGHGRASGGKLVPKDGDTAGAARALCELFVEGIEAKSDGPRPVCMDEAGAPDSNSQEWGRS